MESVRNAQQKWFYQKTSLALFPMASCLSMSCLVLFCLADDIPVNNPNNTTYFVLTLDWTLSPRHEVLSLMTHNPQRTNVDMIKTCENIKFSVFTKFSIGIPMSNVITVWISVTVGQLTCWSLWSFAWDKMHSTPSLILWVQPTETARNITKGIIKTSKRNKK